MSPLSYKIFPLQYVKERKRLKLNSDLIFFFLLKHLVYCSLLLGLIVLMMERFVFSLFFLPALIYAELIQYLDSFSSACINNYAKSNDT